VRRLSVLPSGERLRRELRPEPRGARWRDHDL